MGTKSRVHSFSDNYQPSPAGDAGGRQHRYAFTLKTSKQKGEDPRGGGAKERKGKEGISNSKPYEQPFHWESQPRARRLGGPGQGARQLGTAQSPRTKGMVY